MKSLRTLGIAVGLAAVCFLALMAVKRNVFPWQRVGTISEIAPPSSNRAKLAPVKFTEDDWPCWRGSRGNGSTVARPVTEWSETQNILWKSPMPGTGHASPIVINDRVFIATADDRDKSQSLHCFDPNTGKQVWSKVIHTGGFMAKHPKNSHASATPASDGERVYVPFLHSGGLWVTALDFSGNIVWQTEAGPFVSEHGYGGSPALWGSFVIVNGDSVGGGFIAALQRDTGAIAWRKQRPNNGAHGSYGSPIIAHLSGKYQLIQNGAGKVTSYDPDTGDILWHCAGPAQVTGNTCAFDDRHVVASGGFPEKVIMCIRADGQGDVTASHVLWRSAKGVAYVPSPLITDGLAFLLQDQGVLTCLEIATGKQVWKERLDGEFTASPVLADGLIYLANESGKTFVVRAGRDHELVAANQLDEGGLATPALAGRRIYLRTARHLYCIGTTANEQVSKNEP